MLRRDQGHVFVAEYDTSPGRLDKPGDQAQRRRFATTGRAEQAQEFAFLDIQVEFVATF